MNQARLGASLATSVLVLLTCALAFPTEACDALKCVTHHDTIPNFAGFPTIQSARSGAWSDPGTWTAGRVPAAPDVARISAGTTVSYDLPDGRVRVVGIEGGARLTFRTDVSTRLTVATLLVLPQGELRIGTEALPVPAGVTAELVIADEPLDVVDDGVGTFDPQQYGTGLLSIDGTVSMHGAAKTGYVRVAAEPRAGALTLRLTEAVSGWRAGDRLFLPDSKHFAIETIPYVFEGEEMTLAGVSPDGTLLTLASPLRFDHPGARDGDGVLEFLPHVGNLSRNVVVRSESPAGTRGHVLLTHRADVDIRYAAFRNLGRTTIDPLDNTSFDAGGQVTHIGTNQIGRYPLHLHHLMGPASPPGAGYQLVVLGNAVEDEASYNRHKWGITVHNSHYGLIRGNVVYNAAGWGIGTETGNESFNDFSGNFVARVRGEGGRANSEGGLGFWLRGPNNHVRDNVVANVMGNAAEGARGYELFFVHLGDIRVPGFRGADVAVDGQFTLVPGNGLPLLEFAGNEVYGPTEIGLSIWWLGTRDTAPVDVPESVVKDFRVWHHSRYGYYGYPANRLTFDGFVARGDKDVLANRHEFVLGIWFGDYMNQDVVIRNADIQNLRTGIVPPYFMRGRTLIEDSYLRNANNVVVTTIGAPGSAPYGPDMPPKETILRNVRFGTVDGPVGGGEQSAIAMDYTLHGGSANLVARDAVFVYDYDQVPGDNFQVFYHQQHPDFVVPPSSGNLAGAPEAGLTNAESWARYGIAIAGEVATSATTRPGIDGLVRDLPAALSPVALGLSLDRSTLRPGDTLRVSVTAANPGPDVLADVFFGIVLPAAAGAALGCPGGGAAAFLADGFARVSVHCLSSPPSEFPPLFRAVAIPAALPATTIAGFFSRPLPPDLPAGVYTVFLGLTRPDALAASPLAPDALLGVATAAFTQAP